MRTLEEIKADIEKLEEEKREVREAMRDSELSDARNLYRGKWLLKYMHTARLRMDASTRVPGNYDLVHVLDVDDVTEWKIAFLADLVVKIRRVSAEERSFAVHPHSVPGIYSADPGDFTRGFAEVVTPEMAMRILHDNEAELKGMLYDAEKIAEQLIGGDHGNA